MKRADVAPMVLLGSLLLGACSNSGSNADNPPVPRIHADPSSPSYQDGYGEGQALSTSGVYMSWSGGIATAPIAVCLSHFDASTGDNQTQWGLGCVAAVKALGGANGTPPSAVNSSPPTGSTASTGSTGSTGNAPTPTVPTTTTTVPTTTTTTIPPTTTTTIPLQAAYQAGYQAGQATFRGDSPSQIQAYCASALTYAPEISQSPALAAQFVAGCAAGAGG
jgi:hypothetical protein